MKTIFFDIFRCLFLIISKISYPLFTEEYVTIAGFKARYLTGNNQYLLNYLESIETSFNYYFFTKNKAVYRELDKQYPGKILYAYSFKTAIILLKSKVLIITSGPDDFSPYPLLKSKIIINIWHGTPIKKVGFPKDNKAIKQFIDFTNSLDYFSVSSDFDGEIIKEAFKLNSNKIFVSGLCKNDYISINQNPILNDYPFLTKKIILYAPTFRDEGIRNTSFIDLFPIKELNSLLEKHDAYFLYRSHFNTDEQKALIGYNRIISASARTFLDPQPLLYFSDIMITDYSGIYFDYLLMERPIIFYNYDYEEYSKVREFLYNYEDNTPGPKVQTQKELLKAISIYIENPNLDVEFRTRIKNKFHKYPEGGACERTYKLIKDSL